METGNTVLTVRCPKTIHKQMRIRIAQEGIPSYQELVLALIEKWLSEKSTDISTYTGKDVKDITGELTNDEPREYSTSVPLLGKSLGKLVKRYGADAVEHLAAAVLHMEELSLARYPEEPLPPDIPNPDADGPKGSGQDHGRMGKQVSRRRKAS